MIHFSVNLEIPQHNYWCNTSKPNRLMLTCWLPFLQTDQGFDKVWCFVREKIPISMNYVELEVMLQNKTTQWNSAVRTSKVGLTFVVSKEMHLDKKTFLLNMVTLLHAHFALQGFLHETDPEPKFTSSPEALKMRVFVRFWFFKKLTFRIFLRRLSNTPCHFFALAVVKITQ